MKATGTNTAHSTSAMAMIGPAHLIHGLVGGVARRQASSMWRSTFSTTTMASSTTMPMASTSPNSERVLMEKPNASRTAKVPTIDTGTATSGMIEARQVWRNSTTTSTTRRIASKSVLTTSRIDVPHVDRGVVDDPVVHALGEVCFSSSIVARTVPRSFERIRARRLEDADADGLLAVQQGPERVVAGAQLEPGDVAEPGDLTVGAGLEDDVAELLLTGQAAAGIDA